MFGLHHLYMRNYWVGIAYLFSFGLFGFGWFFDLFLIAFYYWPEIKRSLKKAKDKHPKWVSKYRIKRNFCTILMTWCPLGGFIGLPYFYAGDILVAICRFLTLNIWFVGWIFDLFRLKSIINRYNNDIDEQIEKSLLLLSKQQEKINIEIKNNKGSNNANIANNQLEVEETKLDPKQAEKSNNIDEMKNIDSEQKNESISNLDLTNRNKPERQNTGKIEEKQIVNSKNEEIRVERRFRLKKTLYDAYIIWLGSLGFLGFHHLYLENWVMFLGHILTFGGFGIMWIADFCLMPWFVRSANKRLGFVNNDSNVSNQSKKDEIGSLDDLVAQVNNNNRTKTIGNSPKQLGNAIIAMSLDAQFGSSDNSSNEEMKTPQNQSASLSPASDINDANRKLQSVSPVSSEKAKELEKKNEEQRKEEKLKFRRKLYTAYLFWMPLMGFFGVYYLYFATLQNVFNSIFNTKYMVCWLDI